MNRIAPLVGILAAALVGCTGGTTDTGWQPQDTGDTDEPVDNDQDGFTSDVDCDDDDPDINPGEAEICNEIDDNCDGFVDEGFDFDGDGYYSQRDCTFGDDCDDRDEDVNPAATEAPYNGTDEDCSGADLTDVDGDGFDSTEVRDGTDCNDDDATIYPEATEVPYDGIDQDCSGADLLDVDADGHDSADFGGDDCADDDPYTNPSRMDWANDEQDQDCDGSDGDNADYRLSRAEYVLAGTDFVPDNVGSTIVTCDFDGDSVQDVLVGSWGTSDYQGQISVFLHQYADDWSEEMTLDASPDIKIVGSGSRGFFGMDFKCGDLNGDGRDDLVVIGGEINISGYDSDLRVLVYYGDDDWSWTMDEDDFDATWTADLWGTTGGSSTIRSPSLDLGDLDGDGQDEVVLGFEENFWPDLERDVLHVIPGRRYTGTEDLLDLDKVTLTMSDPVNETRRTGIYGKVIPDIDGDGLNDLAVVQPFYQVETEPGDADPVFEGRILMYSGLEADGTLEELAYASFLGGADDQIGFPDLVIADVDGSGIDDLIVPAPFASEKADSAGLLYVLADPSGLTGTDAALGDVADGILYTGDENGQLGYTVLAAPDIDADGTHDVYVRQRNFLAETSGSNDDLFLVGGHHLTDGEVDVENAYLLSFSRESDQAFTGGGFAVDDVTGDNQPDFFIGAPLYPTADWRGSVPTGRAYFYPSENYPWGYTMGIPVEGGGEGG